jgi:hypothetical protein
MPNPEQLGHAGLAGWRGVVADKLAGPVASKAPASEDQVRAAVGAAFFLLSLYYVISTIAKMARASRR